MIRRPPISTLSPSTTPSHSRKVATQGVPQRPRPERRGRQRVPQHADQKPGAGAPPGLRPNRVDEQRQQQEVRRHAVVTQPGAQRELQQHQPPEDGYEPVAVAPPHGPCSPRPNTARRPPAAPLLPPVRIMT